VKDEGVDGEGPPSGRCHMPQHTRCCTVVRFRVGYLTECRTRVRRSVRCSTRVRAKGWGGGLTCSLPKLQSRRHRARRLSWSDPTKYNGLEVTEEANAEKQKMESHTQTAWKLQRSRDTIPGMSPAPRRFEPRRRHRKVLKYAWSYRRLFARVCLGFGLGLGLG
jgi:hypothetical protein